jgi:hypothetical protein
VVVIPHPKNYHLRDIIYTLISEGRKQKEIAGLLKEKGIKIGKSRVSQLVKELEHDEYIRCDVRTIYKSYVITKKPYPYKSRSLQTSRCDCKKDLRIHNLFFKYRILSKSPITNDLKQWDRVIPMKNGVTQFIYYGHDTHGQQVTIQRFEGKNTDTLMMKIGDMDWPYDKLDTFEGFILEKRIRIEYGIMHQFKMQMEFVDRPKASYAIRPAPFLELQQAFLSDNFKVGDLEGDSSIGGIPELETDSKSKAIAIMEFLNCADSGYFPQVIDVLKKLKNIGVPVETIIELMKQHSKEHLSCEQENRERGVIG